MTAPRAQTPGLQGDAAPSHPITTEAFGDPVAEYCAPRFHHDPSLAHRWGRYGRARSMPGEQSRRRSSTAWSCCGGSPESPVAQLLLLWRRASQETGWVAGVCGAGGEKAVPRGTDLLQHPLAYFCGKRSVRRVGTEFFCQPSVGNDRTPEHVCLSRDVQRDVIQILGGKGRRIQRRKAWVGSVAAGVFDKLHGRGLQTDVRIGTVYQKWRFFAIGRDKTP